MTILKFSSIIFLVSTMGLVLTSNDICKNCKYYQALYTKRKMRFKTLIGHCMHHEITKRNTRSISPTAKHCDFREQCEDNTFERNVSIRKEISDMRKKLTQILEILENEE